WPNHHHVVKSAALKTAPYDYAGPADTAPNLEKMLEDLRAAKPGDVVLLQGPCHNPTGVDLAEDQWKEVANFCNAQGLTALIDVAYHGFASSLEDDLKGAQTFLAHVDEALVAYSCSKNFGLYRDRSGCLLLQSKTQDIAEASATHLADIGRAVYSMPPAHGPAIVATILNDPALKQAWTDEVDAMRTRVNMLRQGIADALVPRSNSYDPQTLVKQNGMFSQLPFKEGGIAALKEKGIYIPGSGRINIAGLSQSDVARAAEMMSEYL
ncbi:MAG: aminotransferase class I/II-fold pyridoxal phosphate-dependent enzyme, partial [Pseudomonadota bacterium]